MAGMEASTMTSEGTCRLVMPLSESTMASAGPSARPFLMAAWTPSRTSSGSSSSPPRMEARPLLGLRPAAASCSPYVSNSSVK
ncbi:hypothetical protein D9M72_526280 [compost metagenome]